ncbi:MAG: 50S ribosomal protein L25 [Gemmatimonadales bacterium]|jgi:large subunit ribosomal protein L25
MNTRETATLAVEMREGRGKGDARKLRAAGQIPANIYGHGIDSIAVAADAHEFDALTSRISGNTLVELQLEGKSRQVLIREIQRHPYKPQVLHVDFFAIRADETIRVSVPVHIVGTATGVKNSGGVLQQALNQVEIECLPNEIPEAFEIDVSALEIGDSLHVSDLDTMGFETSEAPERTIVTVQPPRLLEEETEEEEELEGLEGLEPEVISARGEEEEDAEAEDEEEES